MLRARVTSWDVRVAARAAAFALLALLLAWLVTAVTDEGGVAWGERAGRTLPLAPACAALGACLALAPARGRGETRALEALGRAPWQNAAGAALGGAFVAMMAACAIAASPAIDVGGFYPMATHGADYRFEGGAFVDDARGLRIEPDGALSRVAHDLSRGAGRTAASIPSHGRAAAALATALAGLALALLAAHVMQPFPMSRTRGQGHAREPSVVRAIAVAAASALATVVLFQAAAARHVPAFAAVLPSVMLLAITVWRYRSAHRRPTPQQGDRWAKPATGV
jgi:hypothetical protein